MNENDLTFLCNLESATLCTFKKGEIVINQGEPVKYIYLLVKGICEHLEYSQAGDEIVYFKKTPNAGLDSIIGLNHLWLPDHIAISSFLAKTDLVCIRIELDEAKKEILMHPAIVESILSSLAIKFYDLRLMFNFRHNRQTPNQICNLLISNIIERKEKKYIPKAVSNVAISRRLGVHQVTVAKIMSYLQKEKIIEKTKDGIIVRNLAALQEYADGKKMDYLISQ